jgi:hypothetical protein
MGAGHAILQNGVEKIGVDGNVVILAAGRSDVDGFCIKGRTPSGFDSNLLSVFHNSSGNDAINYNGKTSNPKNLANCEYVTDRIKEVQLKLKPVNFRSNEYANIGGHTIPESGQFVGLYNSSVGSPTNANNYFGNWNSGINVHIDQLMKPDGKQFSQGETYLLAGTVSVFGKESGRLFFRHSISSVARGASDDFVRITFISRVSTFAVGATSADTKYALIVEGLM